MQNNIKQTKQHESVYIKIHFNQLQLTQMKLVFPNILIINLKFQMKNINIMRLKEENKICSVRQKKLNGHKLRVTKELETYIKI